MVTSIAPHALLVMSEDVYRDQFGPSEMVRLAGMVQLGDPVWTAELSSSAARSRLGEVEVLLTSWGCPRLTEDVLTAAPRLRAVLHCAGTIRPLVSEAVWHRGLTVTSAADANAVPVAEYTFAAIIMAGKKAPFLAADARIHGDDWSYVERRGELSNYGRRIGVVGFSRVGRQVVQRLRTLETAEVLVADPTARPEEVSASQARLVGLAELLGTCDIVSLHAPALPETHHMIGSMELALMPDGATLINTARGALVDGAALEEECVAGRLYAILDVTDPEPLPRSSVLYSLANVMVTPHIAGSRHSETRRMVAAALNQLERYVGGRPLTARVTAASLRGSA